MLAKPLKFPRTRRKLKVRIALMKKYATKRGKRRLRRQLKYWFKRRRPGRKRRSRKLRAVYKFTTRLVYSRKRQKLNTRVALFMLSQKRRVLARLDKVRNYITRVVYDLVRGYGIAPAGPVTQNAVHRLAQRASRASAKQGLFRTALLSTPRKNFRNLMRALPRPELLLGATRLRKKLSHFQRPRVTRRQKRYHARTNRMFSRRAKRVVALRRLAVLRKCLRLRSQKHAAVRQFPGLVAQVTHPHSLKGPLIVTTTPARNPILLPRPVGLDESVAQRPPVPGKAALARLAGVRRSRRLVRRTVRSNVRVKGLRTRAQLTLTERASLARYRAVRSGAVPRARLRAVAPVLVGRTIVSNSRSRSAAEVVSGNVRAAVAFYGLTRVYTRLAPITRRQRKASAKLTRLRLNISKRQQKRLRLRVGRISLKQSKRRVFPHKKQKRLLPGRFNTKGLRQKALSLLFRSKRAVFRLARYHHQAPRDFTNATAYERIMNPDAYYFDFQHHVSLALKRLPKRADQRRRAVVPRVVAAATRRIIYLRSRMQTLFPLGVPLQIRPAPRPVDTRAFVRLRAEKELDSVALPTARALRTTGRTMFKLVRGRFSAATRAVSTLRKKKTSYRVRIRKLSLHRRRKVNRARALLRRSRRSPHYVPTWKLRKQRFERVRAFNASARVYRVRRVKKYHRRWTRRLRLRRRMLRKGFRILVYRRRRFRRVHLRLRLSRRWTRAVALRLSRNAAPRLDKFPKGRSRYFSTGKVASWRRKPSYFRTRQHRRIEKKKKQRRIDIRRKQRAAARIRKQQPAARRRRRRKKMPLRRKLRRFKFLLAQTGYRKPLVSIAAPHVASTASAVPSAGSAPHDALTQLQAGVQTLVTSGDLVAHLPALVTLAAFFLAKQRLNQHLILRRREAVFRFKAFIRKKTQNNNVYHKRRIRGPAYRALKGRTRAYKRRFRRLANAPKRAKFGRKLLRRRRLRVARWTRSRARGRYLRYAPSARGLQRLRVRRLRARRNTRSARRGALATRKIFVPRRRARRKQVVRRYRRGKRSKRFNMLKYLVFAELKRKRLRSVRKMRKLLFAVSAKPKPLRRFVYPAQTALFEPQQHSFYAPSVDGDVSDQLWGPVRQYQNIRPSGQRAVLRSGNEKKKQFFASLARAATTDPRNTAAVKLAKLTVLKRLLRTNQLTRLHELGALGELGEYAALGGLLQLSALGGYTKDVKQQLLGQLVATIKGCAFATADTTGRFLLRSHAVTVHKLKRAFFTRSLPGGTPFRHSNAPFGYAVPARVTQAALLRNRLKLANLQRTSTSNGKTVARSNFILAKYSFDKNLKSRAKLLRNRARQKSRRKLISLCRSITKLRPASDQKPFTQLRAVIVARKRKLKRLLRALARVSPGSRFRRISQYTDLGGIRGGKLRYWVRRTKRKKRRPLRRKLKALRRLFFKQQHTLTRMSRGPRSSSRVRAVKVRPKKIRLSRLAAVMTLRRPSSLQELKLTEPQHFITLRSAAQTHSVAMRQAITHKFWAQCVGERRSMQSSTTLLQSYHRAKPWSQKLIIRAPLAGSRAAHMIRLKANVLKLSARSRSRATFYSLKKAGRVLASRVAARVIYFPSNAAATKIWRKAPALKRVTCFRRRTRLRPRRASLIRATAEWLRVGGRIQKGAPTPTVSHIVTSVTVPERQPAPPTPVLPKQPLMAAPGGRLSKSPAQHHRPVTDKNYVTTKIPVSVYNAADGTRSEKKFNISVYDKDVHKHVTIFSRLSPADRAGKEGYDTLGRALKCVGSTNHRVILTGNHADNQRQEILRLIDTFGNPRNKSPVVWSELLQNKKPLGPTTSSVTTVPLDFFSSDELSSIPCDKMRGRLTRFNALPPEARCSPKGEDILTRALRATFSSMEQSSSEDESSQHRKALPLLARAFLLFGKTLDMSSKSNALDSVSSKRK